MYDVINQAGVQPCSNFVCARTAPCANGGSCRDAPEVAGEFECACASGFGGERCEEVTNACANVRCDNNAVCESDGSSYKCNCPVGFYGPRCSDSE